MSVILFPPQSISVYFMSILYQFLCTVTLHQYKINVRPKSPPPPPTCGQSNLCLYPDLQIFMHGNNLNSLHQLIHPEILPSELGGMMPPYDMGTWARTLLDHAYDEETDYCPESYTLSVQDLERDLEKNLSPKTMKRWAHHL